MDSGGTRKSIPVARDRYLLQENAPWVPECIINRSGVAKSVLQTPPSLIHSFIHWSFSSKSSQHHKSQTVRAKDLTQCSLPVMFHVSCVICHVLSVKCQEEKEKERKFLPIGCSSWWRVYHQRGLPRLVWVPVAIFMRVFLWEYSPCARVGVLEDHEHFLVSMECFLGANEWILVPDSIFQVCTLVILLISTRNLSNYEEEGK